jgi:alpha-methylacyl-CoA racemase
VKRILEDVTILDLTQHIPGSYATLLLADFGARVIKVESPTGDAARARPPIVSGSGLRHWMINRGKESIALDLKHNLSQEVFLRLVDQSDAVIQSFRPSTARRLRVDAVTVRSRNPRVIYCALTGYGLDGPYAEKPGHDINYIAMSGMLALGGDPGRLALPGLPPADMTSGLLTAMAVLLGLVSRGSSGEGMLLDVSMMEGVVPWLLTIAEVLNGSPCPESGRSSTTGASPSYSTYMTADAKHISLGIREPLFWRNLRNRLGDGRLPEDLPPDHDEQSREALASIFATRTRDQWEADLGGIDTCFAPVLQPQEVPDHPHVRARGSFPEVGLPGGGSVRSTAAPLLMDGERPAFALRRAPFLGEDGEKLLEELGFSREERRRLVEEQVVVRDPECAPSERSRGN